MVEKGPTARGAVRCYGELGDSNGVRKVYKVLCEALRREFDDDNAEPLPETKALYEELSPYFGRVTQLRGVLAGVGRLLPGEYAARDSRRTAAPPPGRDHVLADEAC